MAGTNTATTTTHKGRGIVRLASAFTTDASGDVTVQALGTAFGRIVSVYYDAGTLATGVDVTLTDALTGFAILTLTNAGTADRIVEPEVNLSLQDGASVAAATTSTNVYKEIYVAGKLNILVAQGGNGGAGHLVVIVDEGGVGKGG